MKKNSSNKLNKFNKDSLKLILAIVNENYDEAEKQLARMAKKQIIRRRNKIERETKLF